MTTIADSIRRVVSGLSAQAANSLADAVGDVDCHRGDAALEVHLAKAEAFTFAARRVSELIPLALAAAAEPVQTAPGAAPLVYSVDALDALDLPYQSVIVDRDGDVWLRVTANGGWRLATEPEAVAMLQNDYAPFRVVYRYEEGEL